MWMPITRQSHKQRPNVHSMLGQRHRRWPSIECTFVQCHPVWSLPDVKCKHSHRFDGGDSGIWFDSLWEWSCVITMVLYHCHGYLWMCCHYSTMYIIYSRYLDIIIQWNWSPQSILAWCSYSTVQITNIIYISVGMQILLLCSNIFF